MLMKHYQKYEANSYTARTMDAYDPRDSDITEAIL